MFHFIFFTLISCFGFLLEKFHLHSHLPQSSHFVLAQLANFLQHKILGARILTLHNLGEPPHYTASSFQLFEILLHLQAYVEATPGSKCAYITLLFLEYQQPKGQTNSSESIKYVSFKITYKLYWLYHFAMHNTVYIENRFYNNTVPATIRILLTIFLLKYS